MDVESDLPRGWDVFYKTGLETTRTSPKPLTDKLYQVPTSRTDKQTGLEKHAESLQPDVQSVLPLQFLMNFWKKRGSSIVQ